MLGAGQVQDEAAGLVVAMLDPQPGEAILDTCAAPGGKALFAAARMLGKVNACCARIQRACFTGPNMNGAVAALPACFATGMARAKQCDIGCTSAHKLWAMKQLA